MKFEEWKNTEDYKSMFAIAGDINKFKGIDQALNFLLKTSYNAGKRINQEKRQDAFQCSRCGCDLQDVQCDACNNGLY